MARKKYAPPHYRVVLNIAKTHLAKEKAFQNEMYRSGVPEWHLVKASEKVVEVLERLGEDGYNRGS